MTEWRWSDLRLHAVEQFGGELPRAQLEAELLEVFESRPRAVAETINAVAEDRAAGQQIRSCWAVLRARLTADAGPLRDVVATDTHERERKLDRARTWMLNAGCHFPSEAEILDELFGSRGMLRDFNDEPTREAMLDCFRDLRPLGEQVEREELERAEQQKLQRARLRAGAAARVDAEAEAAA